MKMRLVAGLVAAAGVLAFTSSTTAPIAPAPAGKTDSGYARFVDAQSDRAKAASKKKRYDEAQAAWEKVLELDPQSLVALEGLATVAAQREDRDGEALALRDLNPLYAEEIAEGNRKLERDWKKSVERQAEIDPFVGADADLVADYGRDIAELGAAYLESDMHANALLCWRMRLDMVEPGSPQAAEALAAAKACLAEGEDFVAGLGLAPEFAPGGKSEAWIEEHDKKTAKWNKAAKWETPHYRIKTNAGYRVGTAAASAMEQVNAFYREIWGIIPDPPPAVPDPALRNIAVPPIDIYVYGSRDEYLQRSGAVEWSGGIFNGSEVHTYASRGNKSMRSTLNTLFHEASHQFMHESVGRVPSFINEGVACLFEGIEILPNGTIRRDLPVKGRLQSLAAALRTKSALPLSEVMAGKSSTENKPEYYAYRWGLVYFLRMYVDDEGNYVYRDRLQDYIYEFKKGDLGNLVEHFDGFFIEPLDVPGIDNFDDFERVWKQWILELDDEVRSETSRVDEYRKLASEAAAKGDHETALRFYERAWELDADDLEAAHGIVEATNALQRIDQTVFMSRRFLEMAPEKDERRAAVAARMADLDPHAERWAELRDTFSQGMHALAVDYEGEEMPLSAMRVAFDTLGVFPEDASAQALVSRLTEQTGRTGVRWRALFNTFDLEGWYSTQGLGPFYVEDGQLICDYSRVEGGATKIERGVSSFRAIFADRAVLGDWSMEVRIRTDGDWGIAGLCFGATSPQDYEAIVLRKTGPTRNNVDLASFVDGNPTFRADGSFKAVYDPASPEGTLLRIDVRNREVTVTIDGETLPIVEKGIRKTSLKYPLAALRGDAGLLASLGVTRFTEMRFLGQTEGGP